MKKETLQSFTKIENLSTPKEVRNFLETNPEKVEDVIQDLQVRINKSYAEKLGEDDVLIRMLFECYDLTKQTNEKEILGNLTYEHNRLLIAATLHNSITKARYFPSVTTISKETGLSRPTIYKHLKSGFRNEYNQLVTGKLNYMVGSALEQLYLIGVEQSNAGALKTFIELSGALNKEPPAKISNYIQINNITLSQDEIKSLPDNIKSEIESLIKEYKNTT